MDGRTGDVNGGRTGAVGQCKKFVSRPPEICRGYAPPWIVVERRRRGRMPPPPLQSAIKDESGKRLAAIDWRSVVVISGNERLMLWISTKALGRSKFDPRLWKIEAATSKGSAAELQNIKGTTAVSQQRTCCCCCQDSG